MDYFSEAQHDTKRIVDTTRHEHAWAFSDGPGLPQHDSLAISNYELINFL